MARDKAKDDKLFNCSQQHELKYVASLYPDHKMVLEFLILRCADGTITNLTHKQVYELIHRELGFPIPR